MARRRQPNSISLFPFLAVLVCMMGALILLLLVTTRKIRHDQILDSVSKVVASAAESSPPEIAKSADGHSRANRQLEIASLEKQIAAADRELLSRSTALHSKRRQAEVLAQFVRQQESELSLLRAELKSAEETLRALQSQKSETDPAALERQTDDLSVRRRSLQVQYDQTTRLLLQKQKELEQVHNQTTKDVSRFGELRSALLSLRSQVDERRRAAVDSSGTTTIVEFTNPTGTTRTPIVIDISEKGYEFLPTGVRFTKQDLEGFPVKDNPLLSGILELHRLRSGNSVTSEPYVLLLVRPSGCLLFYPAQHILTETKIHFGYELLEEDKIINAGGKDEREVRIVRTAILEALNRRETLYAVYRAEVAAVMERQNDDTPESRRLVVRPDGRVSSGEELGRRPLEGKFYAGGVAPIPQHYAPRKRPVRPPALVDDDTSLAASGKPTGSGLAGRVDGRPEPPGNTDPKSSPSGSASAAFGNSPRTASESQSPFAAEADREKWFDQWVQNHSAGGSPAPKEPQPKTNSSVTGSRSAEATETAMSAATLPPDVVTPDTSATERFPGPAYQPPGVRPSPRADSKSYEMSKTEIEYPGSRPPATTSDSSDSLFQSQFPSPAAQGTQTASSGFPMAGDASQNAGGKPADLTKLDPDLARLLKSRNSQNSRDNATPVGITVFVDEYHLTVGQRAAVSIADGMLDTVFAELLAGISEEVQASRRSPGEPVLPIVKFVVSPGGERNRIPLARELRVIGIPSASIVAITPYITPVDDVGRARLEPSEPLERTSEDDERELRVRSVSGQQRSSRP